jgi:hypothetical protein
MKYLPFALAGVLLFLAGTSCGQPKPPQEQAIDTMAIRIEQSEKDSLRWSGVVDSLGDEASRYQMDAGAARREAARLASVANALRGSAGGGQHPETGSDRNTIPQTGQAPTVTKLPTTEAWDSLTQAYALMVRVDSLNQLALASKDSIIAADRQYIASLERVRDAGRQVIKSRPSFLSKILPRPSIGYGVTYANRELVHGPLIALTWRF